jgi:signal transduction histidine kinase
MPVISLKNRLILTYALSISAALLALTLVINLSIETIFSGLIKNNIKEQSREIIRTITEQYDPVLGGFDLIALEALGMYFVHDGYIVTVEDPQGAAIWDARTTDMQRCAAVLNEITERMENEFRLTGNVQKERYPLAYGNQNAGAVTIETYGPFFYTETESGFLASINRVLLIAGITLTLLSAAISVALAAALSRPILEAGAAARRIAREYAGGGLSGRREPMQIRENYQTRELYELSRSVNKLAEELQEGERRQKQLSADVAHELRTPLSCLRGNVEAMMEGVWEPTPQRLLSCHEEILRLSKLVDDLHLLTSLEWESLVLDKTDFDLAKLLEDTAGQFIPAARDKGIEIILNLEPCLVCGDYNRLKQVFINLLSNGVKYTDRGKVEVTLTGDREKGLVRVSVADTGIGIAGEAIPHIFERFYRSDKSRNRKTGGAGIGLTIAAAIVKAHGGRISAESRTGETGESGSLFTVEFLKF